MEVNKKSALRTRSFSDKVSGLARVSAASVPAAA